MASPHIDFWREAVIEPCGAATLHTQCDGERSCVVAVQIWSTHSVTGERSCVDLSSQEPNQVDVRLVLKQEYCEDERLA